MELCRKMYAIVCAVPDHALDVLPKLPENVPVRVIMKKRLT